MLLIKRRSIGLSTLRCGVALALLVAACCARGQQRATAITPQQVVAELNRLRADPAAYAERLERRREWYRGLELRQPGSGVVVNTVEGAAALDEVIGVLRRTPALLLLKPASGLARAAQDHARDLIRGRFESHTGSDGSTPDVRISRHGSWTGSCGEALNFARSLTAEDIVIDLLIDDGVRDRGHRNLLLHALMTRAGVAVVPHPRYGLLAVIEMAEGYTDGLKR